MFFDFLKAELIAGVPVAIISYNLTIWTSKKIPLKAINAKQLKLELKGEKVTKDSEESMVQHFVHKKWLRFGGGFYGVLTFITYMHIEVYQIVEFLQNFTGLQNFIDNISLWMIINFFIEAVTNLITAFLWPIYWFDFLPIDSFWVWFIVVFTAHVIATKLALSNNKNQ